ncbi:TIGR03618 family F420-dependent PPOX class oxidoreductase [Anaerolineae bacterium CFX7]|nr:TIGR03618 family F420-dependent PPOX class oxidoreductase [Anaerolineae bacterium CFX7]
MKINILGGGPAGLYFALLLKKQNPAHEITVVERDGPNDTFGWGIVFSDTTLDNFALHDRASYADFVAAAQKRDSVYIQHRGVRERVRGNPISGVARLTWLQILHRHCAQHGVKILFHTNVTNVNAYADCDLLVGADGANSLVRKTYEGFFMPFIETRQNKYVWLGTTQTFDGLTMMFKQSDVGLFIGHAYQFSPTHSTFVVECPPETWVNAGFDTMSPDDTVKYLEQVFRSELDGNPLWHNNFLRWQNFPLIKNRRWHHLPKHGAPIVLVGDALHTAHFSIGSGTKLAMEDSIALAECFARNADATVALPEYERVRKPVVWRFQTAALRSLAWLEDVEKYLYLDPLPFAYRVMTRSQRVSYQRMKLADPEFTARYGAWYRAQAHPGVIPPEFLDLFEKKSFGHLATLMPDGTPQVTTVMVDFDGTYIVINSARGRIKDRNMQERPNVAVQIPDPDNSDRFLAVRGSVVEITEAGADEHLNKLAQRYLEKDEYPASMRFPGEVRALYKIMPHKVTVWDPWGIIPPRERLRTESGDEA